MIDLNASPDVWLRSFQLEVSSTPALWVILLVDHCNRIEFYPPRASVRAIGQAQSPRTEFRTITYILKKRQKHHEKTRARAAFEQSRAPPGAEGSHRPDPEAS